MVMDMFCLNLVQQKVLSLLINLHPAKILLLYIYCRLGLVGTFNAGPGGACHVMQMYDTYVNIDAPFQGPYWIVLFLHAKLLRRIFSLEIIYAIFITI